jgi:hypothetical protein
MDDGRLITGRGVAGKNRHKMQGKGEKTGHENRGVSAAKQVESKGMSRKQIIITGRGYGG